MLDTSSVSSSETRVLLTCIIIIPCRVDVSFGKIEDPFRFRRGVPQWTQYPGTRKYLKKKKEGSLAQSTSIRRAGGVIAPKGKAGFLR